MKSRRIATSSAIVAVALAGAGAQSALSVTAPKLAGWRLGVNKICGFPDAVLSRTLQAGNRAELLYWLRFEGELKMVFTAKELARVRLHARGAGVDIGRRADSGIFRRYRQAGLMIEARRAGRVKIWATVDGVATNTREVRVLPARAACGG